jgi:hypothetical protein
MVIEPGLWGTKILSVAPYLHQSLLVFQIEGCKQDGSKDERRDRNVAQEGQKAIQEGQTDGRKEARTDESKE